MFNFGIKLRKQYHFEVPRCLGSSGGKSKRFIANGTLISLVLPKGDTRGRRLDCASPGQLNLDQHQFDNLRTGVTSWRYLSLASRHWRFCGDWFVGALGGVEMSFGIIKPPMQPQTSLFNPRVLESVVAESLALQFGHEVDFETRYQRWLAPYTWTPVMRNGVSFACYTAEVSKGPSIESPIYFAECAIADDLLLSMRVRVQRGNVYIASNREPEPEPDAWVSIEPMKAMADQLVNSVLVELSPYARAQQTAALDGLDAPTLSAAFAPLKFV
jgi:hypothetical protein